MLYFKYFLPVSRPLLQPSFSCQKCCLEITNNSVSNSLSEDRRQSRLMKSSDGLEHFFKANSISFKLARSNGRKNLFLFALSASEQTVETIAILQQLCPGMPRVGITTAKNESYGVWNSSCERGAMPRVLGLVEILPDKH